MMADKDADAMVKELRLWKLVARDYYQQYRKHYSTRYVSDSEMEADLTSKLRHYKRIEELKC